MGPKHLRLHVRDDVSPIFEPLLSLSFPTLHCLHIPLQAAKTLGFGLEYAPSLRSLEIAILVPSDTPQRRPRQADPQGRSMSFEYHLRMGMEYLTQLVTESPSPRAQRMRFCILTGYSSWAWGDNVMGSFHMRQAWTTICANSSWRNLEIVPVFGWVKLNNWFPQCSSDSSKIETMGRYEIGKISHEKPRGGSYDSWWEEGICAGWCCPISAIPLGVTVKGRYISGC